MDDEGVFCLRLGEGINMKDIEFIHFRGLLAFLFILSGLVFLSYMVWGKL